MYFSSYKPYRQLQKKIQGASKNSSNQDLTVQLSSVVCKWHHAVP